MSRYMNDDDQLKNKISKKPTRPVWFGLHALAIDTGLTGMVMIASVLLLSFTNIAIKQPLTEYPIAVAVGLSTSIYAAYILRRRYTDKLEGLLGLLAFGVMANSVLAVMDATDIKLVILGVVGQTVSYGLGWQLADKNLISVTLPSLGWIRAFSIVGYIVLSIILFSGISLF